MVNFNLTDEILETVHTVALKMIFGDSNIGLKTDAITIEVEARKEELSVPAAFRVAWVQHLNKSTSLMRLLLFDPLSDWCLTPNERQAKRNAEVIKDYLHKKVEEHKAWRKDNPIKSAEDPIYLCDIMMADTKIFADED